MAAYAGIHAGVDAALFVRLSDAARNAQPLRVGPGQFPELLGGAPHAAQAACAFAQVGLCPCDAYGDDFIVAAPRVSRARGPWDGFDNELDGLQPAGSLLVVKVAHADQPFAVALDELLGAVLTCCRVRRVSTQR